MTSAELHKKLGWTTNPALRARLLDLYKQALLREQAAAEAERQARLHSAAAKAAPYLVRLFKLVRAETYGAAADFIIEETWLETEDVLKELLRRLFRFCRDCEYLGTEARGSGLCAGGRGCVWAMRRALEDALEWRRWQNLLRGGTFRVPKLPLAQVDNPDPPWF